jgi:hypothetical protein
MSWSDIDLRARDSLSGTASVGAKKRASHPPLIVRGVARKAAVAEPQIHRARTASARSQLEILEQAIDFPPHALEWPPLGWTIGPLLFVSHRKLVAAAAMSLLLILVMTEIPTSTATPAPPCHVFD